MQEVIFEDVVVLRGHILSIPLYRKKPKKPYKPKNEDCDKDALSECERPSQ